MTGRPAASAGVLLLAALTRRRDRRGGGHDHRDVGPPVAPYRSAAVPADFRQR
jgi:hypothetical protein